jgi:hypothetical protein
MEDVLFMIGIAIIVGIACLGYWGHAENLKKHEASNFELLPWLIFSLIGIADCTNMLLSHDVTLTMFVAGVIIALGPIYISVIIFRAMWENYEGKKSFSTVLQKLYDEFGKSQEQRRALITLLLTLSILEASPYGDLWFVEWSFALVTIALDFVALQELIADVKKAPQTFEYSSWILWGIAAVFAYFLNGIAEQQWFSVATVLTLENAIISYIVIRKIYLCRK